MINHCVVNKDGKEVEGVLIGVFQKHTMIVDPSNMFGGHQGGVVAGPVAVVRIGNKFEEVGIGDLTLRYRENIPLPTKKSKPEAVSMGEVISSGFKEGLESGPYKSGDIFKPILKPNINITIDESKMGGFAKDDFNKYRESIIKGFHDYYGINARGSSRK